MVWKLIEKTGVKSKLQNDELSLHFTDIRFNEHIKNFFNTNRVDIFLDKENKKMLIKSSLSDQARKICLIRNGKYIFYQISFYQKFIKHSRYKVTFNETDKSIEFTYIEKEIK